MSDICNSIREKLYVLQDLQYRDFQSGLMPEIDKETIIGVRTPELRKFAKELVKDPDVYIFLAQLPHKYYDENNLHGFVIEQIKDYDRCIEHTDNFLPYVDNWATCDLMSPGVFRKNTDKLIVEIKKWIYSDKTYAVRFGIEMLMKYYLDEHFSDEYPEMVSVIRSEEYYINMMISWYFATALAKQYESIVSYIEGRKLDVWTHNKTIQKACESRRITDEQKKYLKSLKIK